MKEKSSEDEIGHGRKERKQRRRGKEQNAVLGKIEERYK